MSKGYEQVIDALAVLGVEQVFGVMGNGNLPWLAAAAERHAFDYLPVRHESSGVNAASAYARTTGRVGIATATHGPGLGNAFTSLVAAVRDRSPVVMVVGAVPAADPDSGQRLDHEAFADLCGAGFHQVTDETKIATTIVKAGNAALWTLVPQVVNIPTNFFDLDIPDVEHPMQVAAASPQSPSGDVIDQVLDLIDGAQRPVILAGNGAVAGGAHDALESLGDAIGALFSTSLLANHLFSSSPANVGVSGGLSHAVGHDLLRNADLVLAFGVALNKYTTEGFSLYDRATVVQVVNTPGAVANLQRLDLAVVGDAAVTADALRQAWQRRHPEPRVGYRTVEVMASLEQFAAHRYENDISGPTGLDPRSVYLRLHEMLPPDRVVVTDGGRFAETMHNILITQDARSYLWCSGFASIGLGLGSVAGAAAAHPDRPIVLVSGDGGFMMAAQELDTLVRCGRSITVVVMNDRQYGAETRHLGHLHMPVDSARFATPDLVQVARGFGGDGIKVGTLEELQALEWDSARPGLFLIDVQMDQNFDAMKLAYDSGDARRSMASGETDRVLTGTPAGDPAGTPDGDPAGAESVAARVDPAALERAAVEGVQNLDGAARFTETAQLDAPRATAFALLDELEAVAVRIPGVSEVRMLDERSFTCRMTQRVGIVTARFDLTLHVVLADEPGHVVVAADGMDSRLASTVRARLAFDLRDGGDRTPIDIDAQIVIDGRLASFGHVQRVAAGKVSEIVQGGFANVNELLASRAREAAAVDVR